MTQDEIIEMAQECKLIGMRPHLDGIYSESLVAFANLIYVKALAQTQEPWCMKMNGCETKCEDCPDKSAQPESWEKFCDSNCVWTDHHPDCRLAQTQEPVALQYPQKDIDWQYEQQIKAQASTPPQGIYYTPPQRTWVGLTDEDICMFSMWLDDKSDVAIFTAIEAKLKEKNT